MQDNTFYATILSELNNHELAEVFGLELQRRSCTGIIVCWDRSTGKVTSAAALADTWREEFPDMTLAAEMRLIAAYMEMADEETRRVFPADEVE
jgi:hypothetical protein